MYEEITPLLPTGIGEIFSQTISNLGHAALLRRCELPPRNESGKGNTFYLSQVKYRVKLKFVVLLWPLGADKVSC